ncbi:GTPase [Chloroflexota bacterium]
MPANLPPQYYEAEKRFRSAKDTDDKIAVLEEMLAIMPKHKGTDHLKADLRRKIAKLTQEAERKSATQRTSLVIEKQGAAQVVVIGLPNAGKSQLVSSLTSAVPTVAEYPFTTQAATPGMLEFQNIQIQLIDTPPLTPQYIEPWLPNMLGRAGAMLVVIDLADAPLVQMEAIAAQLAEKRIEMGPNGVKTLVVANKVDISRQSLKELQNQCEGLLPLVAVSAKEGTGLEELKHQLYQTLDIIRVYTKTPGGKPDFSDPIILERGITVEDAAANVHKDFSRNLKYARIWGSGKHDGVMAKRGHVLQDGDVVELHV